MSEDRALQEYGKAYSEESFWAKVGKYAIAAGKQVIEKVLTLYYCLLDRDTPPWAKAVIVGALGYFIVPMDAIPDLIPGVGYADDLGAVGLALGMVAVHIKPEHQEQAKQKLKQWFADNSDQGDQSGEE